MATADTFDKLKARQAILHARSGQQALHGATLHPPLTPQVVQRAQQTPAAVTPSDVQLLQRTVGNRAVAQLLAHNRPTRAPIGVQRQHALDVGPVDDRYEQEADKIANTVANTVADTIVSPATASMVQREGLQQEDGQQERGNDMTLRSVLPSIGVEGGQVGQSQANLLQRTSGGTSLPDNVRRTLEPRLGADLSQVKIHTDSRAADLNRQFNAKAFTHKNHIYYGKGQSPQDLRLTTHEAVHTIQQGGVQQLQRQPTEDAEVGHRRPIATGATPGMIQRWPWSKKKFFNKDRRRSYGADELPPMQDVGQVATLRMHIYTGEWEDNPVGHAWLELQYHRGQAAMHEDHIDQLPIFPFSKNQLKGGQHASFGFWPLHTTSKPGVMQMRGEDGKTPGEGRTTEQNFGGFRLAPGKTKVQGRVEEDDQKWQHKTNAVISYKLSQPQIDSFADYVNRTREAIYSPFGLNCTTFALKAIAAAGHKPPAKHRISPKGVYKNIKRMAKKGHEHAKVFDSGDFLHHQREIYDI